MLRAPVVHLLHTDGNLACSGIPLEDLATALDPPIITIHLEDTTCPLCRRRARELESGAAA